MTEPTYYRDEEVLSRMTELQSRLDDLQKRVENGDESIQHAQLRPIMSELNELKLQARKRGLREE